MVDFPFLGGSFDGRSPSFDAQKTVNLYPEVSESGSSRSAVALIGTPGLRLWTNLAGGGVRGVIPFTPSIAIAVVGANVWKLTTGAASTLIGNVANNTANVSMASNGSIIMMVADTLGYFIDPSANTVSVIMDPDFQGGTRVDFVDGYFVWTKPGTGQFQVTQLYGTDIDALDFATAEGSPDNLTGVIVNQRTTWLFGTNSTEVWYNAGGADFPLERIQGAFLEIGCAATFSIAKLDNSVFWLATDDRGFGTIQRADGYAPKRVSNYAVEFAISSYGTISDATAYTYAQEGHAFYVISFPTGGATWCLDVSTGIWHERPYFNTSGGFERHRSNCQMNFAGETIVGDWQNGNLYVMDLDHYTDNGQAIYRRRVAPHITNDGNYSFYRALELFMQTGVGLSDGSVPQAMLQWSDDGGYSFGTELWASIGKIGERKARVRWRRLGKSRDRVFAVTVTDPVKVVFTGASLDAVGGEV